MLGKLAVQNVDVDPRKAINKYEDRKFVMMALYYISGVNNSDNQKLFSNSDSWEAPQNQYFHLQLLPSPQMSSFGKSCKAGQL